LENIKENIKISTKEMKQYKPWFDECPRFLDQRKHAKMQ